MNNEPLEKYKKLDELFLESRKGVYGWRKAFTISIEKVFAETPIHTIIELKEVLDRLQDDVSLKVDRNEYEALFTSYEIENDKLTIHGCTKGKLSDHIKRIDKDIKEVKSGPKIKIYIDKTDGIYLDKETKKPNYAIHSDSDRYRIIKALKTGKKIENPQLFILMKTEVVEPIDQFDYKTRDSRARQVSKNIKKINDNIIDNLDVDKDLIIHTTSGYAINNDVFELKFM